MRKYFPYIVIAFLLISVPLSVLVAKTGVRLYSRANGQNANIVIDASSNLGELNKPWAMLAQGGEQTTLFDVVPEVKELNIKYIRIDHAFNKYEVMPSPGVYDFSKLDKVIDSIISMGAKPMIALTYMPTSISASDIIDVPKNWGDWQELIKRTVEHYSGKNNKAIADIYYEVWNEPDLFGGFKIGGKKDYRLLYLYSSRGATSASNTLPFKLGGPATTAPYRNWVVGLLQYIRQEKLRIDFISWHRYHFYPEQFLDDINNVNLWLSNFSEYKNLPKVITEWGSNSDNDPKHDTAFDLAHTIAMSRIFADDISQAYSFEVKDGPDPKNNKFWGRWGLLTNENFGISKKPRYFAIKALNTLSGDRLSVNGEGTWVTAMAARDQDKIKAVIVNYDPKGMHSETAPITLANAGSFKYKVIKTFYSAVNPSGTTSESEEKAQQGEIKLNLNMTPNTTYLIEFVKLESTISLGEGKSGDVNDKSLEISSTDSALTFSVSEVIDPKKGTVDFWVKPKWNGNEGGTYTFFEMPRTDGRVFGAYKTLAGTSRVLSFGVFPEYSVSVNLSNWVANDWHHVTFVWDFTLGEQSYLRILTDGVSGPTVMGNIEPGLSLNFYLGKSSNNNNLIDSYVDEFKTMDGNQNTIKLLHFDDLSGLF